MLAANAISAQQLDDNGFICALKARSGAVARGKPIREPTRRSKHWTAETLVEGCRVVDVAASLSGNGTISWFGRCCTFCPGKNILLDWKCLRYPELGRFLNRNRV